MNYELVYDDTPPSLNKVGSRGGSHWAFTTAKKMWQGVFITLLLQRRVPKGVRSVQATAVLRFPSKRRRDEGNYRALLEKALGDALVLARVIHDDTPDRFRFGKVEFDEERGKARTLIRLEVRDL